MFFNGSLNIILDFLFPKKCLGCKKGGTYCCTECSNAITPLDRQFFPRAATESIEGVFGFTQHQDGSPCTKFIHGLKYDGIRELAAPLASLLHQIIVRHPEKFKNAILVPVPLHWRRKNGRGFNQSELLALRAAESAGIQCQNILVRKRFTRPQVELNRTKRLSNLTGAFKASRSLLIKRQIAYFLVDDVCTTGATLNECASALRKAGAEKVYGLVVARSVMM